METEKVYAMPFAKIYPMLVAKVVRKGRTQAEVDESIEEPLMKEISYLDKLVDELAKGKEMKKIKRTNKAGTKNG
nr:DUF2200 family protein [uncultured Blautia sp.]